MLSSGTALASDSFQVPPRAGGSVSRTKESNKKVCIYIYENSTVMSGSINGPKGFLMRPNMTSNNS